MRPTCCRWAQRRCEWQTRAAAREWEADAAAVFTVTIPLLLLRLFFHFFVWAGHGHVASLIHAFASVQGYIRSYGRGVGLPWKQLWALLVPWWSQSHQRYPHLCASEPLVAWYLDRYIKCLEGDMQRMEHMENFFLQEASWVGIFQQWTVNHQWHWTSTLM